jgi:hypothetical protein
VLTCRQGADSAGRLDALIRVASDDATRTRVVNTVIGLAAGDELHCFQWSRSAQICAA